MMKLRLINLWLIILSLNVFLLAAACGESGKGSAESLMTARRVEMTDADLENAVLSKLRSDARLMDESRLSVRADIDKNLVTLSGIVASDDARTEAVNLAKTARAGLTVHNQIYVQPAVG